MSIYQGMRWLKCDLHVQTPEDGRRWDADDPLRLPSPRIESDLQEKARTYLRRCHEVGLEVIAVTDHNFCAHRNARERFLGHLIEQNATVAQEMGRLPLWIFPGFEVDIGFHVLCLFPPVRRSVHLDQVCDVLTELGLGPNQRFTGGEPADLRRDGDYVALGELMRIVQEERGGLVIAAHAFQRDGIAEKDGRWAGDYRNENLLCVEVSGPELSERERAVFRAAPGAWCRQRPPAYILSSDAKSSRSAATGEARVNSLGYRWTWIKMSEPSVEALRQAFLDPSSRILLDLETDPRILRHDRIDSLSIRDAAFLADQDVAFSPHFNCLIGGRGSGKSSIFESIRLALRQEDRPAAQDQVARIRATLTADSVLRLHWREEDAGDGSPGLEDVFEYRLAKSRSQVISREVADASTIFRGLEAQMFSQGQITAVARQAGFLLELIDGIVGAPLKDLQQEERELQEGIRQLQQKRQILERLRGEEVALQQEVLDLDRRWAARSAVAEEQKRYRAAQEGKRYLEEVIEGGERTASELEHWANEFVQSHSPLGSTVQAWPEAAFFVTLDQALEAAKQGLAEAIRSAARHYQDRISDLTSGSSSWPAVQEALRKAEEDFRSAFARQGLRPDDLEQLAQLEAERRSKNVALTAHRAQIEALVKALGDLREPWARLHALWRQQTGTRRSEIQRVLRSPAIPRQKDDRSVLEVQIEHQGDRDGFLTDWSKLSPDARTRLGKQWEELGNLALGIFAEAPVVGSPWQVVQEWVEETRSFPLASDLLAVFREHLLGRENERWESQRLRRIQDRVDLVLYRNDGTRAGSLAGKQLSEGQINTAVLMLLLASGRGPILIDQPEDELDSSFISEELVPLLREIKNERQVIVVTHNPNLPVNADAELVYALEARSDAGRARGEVRAQGGLDREQVKQAVLDIMEGSEAAFRKRREKYHF